MPSVRFYLRLGPDELQRMYLGVRDAQAVSDDGRRVRFPAKELRPFVTHDGIEGLFELEFTDAGKLVELRSLGRKN